MLRLDYMLSSSGVDTGQGTGLLEYFSPLRGSNWALVKGWGKRYPQLKGVPFRSVVMLLVALHASLTMQPPSLVVRLTFS